MRTTLDIDEPVLHALKELARRQRRTAGAVASELIYRALSQPAGGASPVSGSQPLARSGFRPFAAEPGEVRVSNEQVNRLREDTGA